MPLAAESLTSRLVELLLAKPISLADRQRAAIHLLDWLGCVAAGSQSEVAAIFRSQLSPAEAGVTALWQGRYSLESALAYNAALGNVLEMDDVHRRSILHPGPVVIPAALAVAEYTGASVSQLLDAIILGYEVTIRIGSAVGRSHYRYFHNTSSCGAFGAAMAAGVLWHLSSSQLVSALGNAGSRTGGLWQMRHEGVHTKQWHNAEAAKSGVAASRLALAGLTGPRAILEGPQGFFAAMSEDAEPEKTLEPAAHWLMHDCTFKPWPACRHAHPAIDALETVLQREQLDVTDIAAVEIESYQDALTFCDKPLPRTEAEARFSIQHAIACRLVLGEPELWHYQQAHLQDAAIVAMRARVQLRCVPAFENVYPAHFGAGCVVRLTDGRSYHASIHDTLGDPERPLHEQQLLKKVRSLLTAGALSAERQQALCSLSLPAASSLSALFALLQKE